MSAESPIMITEEPRVLDVEVDQAKAALYDEFVGEVIRTLSSHAADEAVYSLWKDPQVVNPTIRQRALATLTVPVGYQLPYAHPETSVVGLLITTEEVDGRHTRVLRDRMEHRPDLAEELAQGVLYWSRRVIADRKDGVTDAYRYDENARSYQRITQGVLPIVGVAVAKNLLESCPVGGFDGQNAPYDDILKDEGITGEWRYAAFEQWIARADEIRALSPWQGQQADKDDPVYIGMAWWLNYVQPERATEDTVYDSMVRYLEASVPQHKAYALAEHALAVADRIQDVCLQDVLLERHVSAGIGKIYPGVHILDEAGAERLRRLHTTMVQQGKTEIAAEVKDILDKYRVRTEQADQRMAPLRELYQQLKGE